MSNDSVLNKYQAKYFVSEATGESGSKRMTLHCNNSFHDKETRVTCDSHCYVNIKKNEEGLIRRISKEPDEYSQKTLAIIFDEYSKNRPVYYL